MALRNDISQYCHHPDDNQLLGVDHIRSLKLYVSGFMSMRQDCQIVTKSKDKLFFRRKGAVMLST